MSKSINELCKEAHETAVEKGWYDPEPTFGELIALCHSELSEVLEAFRSGAKINEMQYQFEKGSVTVHRDELTFKIQPVELKPAMPAGIPVELADCIIRIFDLCGFYGIDLESAIEEKMQYNQSRPCRHGGKRL